jgi:effector-binding domain-containing protein
MEILKVPDIPRPEFVSEIVIKERPEIKAISLSGKGNPTVNFDPKAAEIFAWLERKGIKPAGHTLGIYYLKRNEVGVDNVVWDACVPVKEEIPVEGDLKFQVLPPAQVSGIVLTGGYDLIGPALKYMDNVLEAKGIKTKWPLTEVYLQEGKEPITELQYFVLE